MLQKRIDALLNVNGKVCEENTKVQYKFEMAVQVM